MTREEFIQTWGTHLTQEQQADMEIDLIMVQEQACESLIEDQNEYHD